MLVEEVFDNDKSSKGKNDRIIKDQRWYPDLDFLKNMEVKINGEISFGMFYLLLLEPSNSIVSMHIRIMFELSMD